MVSEERGGWGRRSNFRYFKEAAEQLYSEYLQQHPELKAKTAKDIADERHAQRTQEQADDIKKRWEERRKAREEAEIYKSTTKAKEEETKEEEKTPLEAAVKERRKELRKLAKPLTDKPLTNPQFDKPIKITNTGIKEWLNQPFCNYEAKNEAILGIDNILKKATYRGFVKDKNDQTLKVHVFETTIANDKAWVIVKEDKAEETYLYSISDNSSVIDRIEKGRP